MDVALTPAVSTFWVLTGIIGSLMLPLAVRTLRAFKEEYPAMEPTWRQRFADAWNRYGGNRYLGVALAATFVAIVLVFFLGLEFFTARDAALAGFAWESFIHKMLGGGERDRIGI